jgi:hypothetical protein
VQREIGAELSSGPADSARGRGRATRTSDERRWQGGCCVIARAHSFATEAGRAERARVAIDVGSADSRARGVQASGERRRARPALARRHGRLDKQAAACLARRLEWCAECGSIGGIATRERRGGSLVARQQQAPDRLQRALCRRRRAKLAWAFVGVVIRPRAGAKGMLASRAESVGSPRKTSRAQRASAL